MKKRIIVWITCMLIFITTCASSESRRFTVKESGMSFLVPEGWTNVPIVGDHSPIKIQVSPPEDNTTFISFSAQDLWGENEASQYGITREEMNFNYLKDNVIEVINPQMIGVTNVKSMEVKSIGDYKYYVITGEIEKTKIGVTFKIDCQAFVTMFNGHIAMFLYMSTNRYEKYYPVFEKVIESVEINDQTPVGNQDVEEEPSEWKDYNIDEIGLHISLPSEFDVMTRNTSADDPAIVRFGLSETVIPYISTYLASLNLYVDAIDSLDNEVVVSAKKSVFQDYSGMKDAEIELMGSTYYAAMWGIEAESIEVYRNNGLAFVRIKGSYENIEDDQRSALIYYTTVNTTEYGFVMSSPERSILPNTEAIMDKIIQSVEITNLQDMYETTDGEQKKAPKPTVRTFIESEERKTPKPTIRPKAKVKPTNTLKIVDYKASDRGLYFDDRAEWIFSGDTLNIRFRMKAGSKNVVAFELYLYATNVWGEKIYGKDKVYHVTTERNIKANKTAYSDYFSLPKRKLIDRVYCGIKRVKFSDGSKKEYELSENDYYNWSIK